MENMNKQIKNEMEEILWTPVDNKTNLNTDVAALAEVEVTDLKQPENQITIENGEEVETPVAAPKAKAPKDPRAKKPAQPKNNDWAEHLPEDKKLAVGTVVCFRPGDLNKIGEFTHYARKENVIWVNMFKKNSTEYMTKPWAVHIDECEIVDDKTTMNDKYGKDDKGAYFVK